MVRKTNKQSDLAIAVRAKFCRGGGAEHIVPKYDFIMWDYLFKAPNPSHEGNSFTESYINSCSSCFARSHVHKDFLSIVAYVPRRLFGWNISTQANSITDSLTNKLKLFKVPLWSNVWYPTFLHICKEFLPNLKSLRAWKVTFFDGFYTRLYGRH